MGVGMLAVLIMGSAGTALADTPGVTFPLNQGTSGITTGTLAFKVDNVSQTIDSSHGIPLDGKDHTIAITMPLTIVDASGTGNGWSATLTATPFHDGSTELHQMPSVGALATPTRVDSSSALDSGDGSAVKLTSNQPVPTYGGTALDLLDVAGSHGYGMGSYTASLQLTLNIQANDYSDGAYASTFHIDFTPGT